MSTKNSISRANKDGFAKLQGDMNWLRSLLTIRDDTKGTKSNSQKNQLNR